MRQPSRLITLLALFAIMVGMMSSVSAQNDYTMYAAESCDYGGEILSIEAVDDMTVKFTLCYPDPAFPSKVAFSALGIYPSEYLESTGGGGVELFQNPIGTGPYVLENWDLGNEIVMTRNDSYWGDPAGEQTLIFRWNSEAAARLVELQAGTADGIDNVGPGDFDVVEMDPNLALYERPGTNVFYLGINNTFEPFNDVRVRQALAYGVDKSRIVDNFYPRGSIVATQFMPPSIFGYTQEVEAFPYDPDMARSLLEEASADLGFDLPLEVDLSYRDVVRSYLPQPSIVATDLQAQLAEIGVSINITPMESGAFLDAADAGELPLFMLGWGADYPDATNFLDYHFGAGANASFGELYPDIVDALTRGAQLADPDARYPIYVEANELIRDEVPMVPIAHGGSGVAFRSVIEGAHSSPLGNENMSVMSDPDDDNLIWMQNGEPAGLYCADETDGEALRVCEQINEALLAYEVAGTAVVPALATDWEASEDLIEWTFTLREGVTFHDGSAFDATDVIASYAVQWDASNPLHVGRDGNFTYFQAFFAAFLNNE